MTEGEAYLPVFADTTVRCVKYCLANVNFLAWDFCEAIEKPLISLENLCVFKIS